VRALHAGIDASDAGADGRDRPYKVNGDLAQQFAAHWWVKGWRRRTEVLRNGTDDD